eukprot:1379267-Amorphochlora_amoeboformis.AAC.1
MIAIFLLDHGNMELDRTFDFPDGKTRQDEQPHAHDSPFCARLFADQRPAVGKEGGVGAKARGAAAMAGI